MAEAEGYSLNDFLHISQAPANRESNRLRRIAVPCQRFAYDEVLLSLALQIKTPGFIPGVFIWRRRRDSNPRGLSPKRFSRPPRYDRFDTPPRLIYLVFYSSRACTQTSLTLAEIIPLLRYFLPLAIPSLRSLQDRLVMTASAIRPFLSSVQRLISVAFASAK